MLNRILLALTETLCFYLILRGIDRFKVKDSLIFIFTTKQYVRWGNIAMLVIYFVVISMTWYHDPELSHQLSMLGSLVIPAFMVQIWRVDLKKVLFIPSFFLLASVSPAIIMYALNLPNLLTYFVVFAFFSLLTQFEFVHKIYQFLAKHSLLLNAWCAVGFLFLMLSFANWYNYGVALFVLLGTFFLGGITVYVIQKYHEKNFTATLAETSYLELKAKLKKKSLRVLETDQLDFYEFNTIWFTKSFADSLKNEFSRLSLTADFVKEGSRLKIHLFKAE